jgi:hypothetical protein
VATVPNLPLSLAQVRAVFGAPARTPLHDFHRGGPWVPNIAANNNVPTSGPIRLAQLVGATNYQALEISGPSSYNFGTIFGARPPTTLGRKVGMGLTGVNGSTTVTWVELVHTPRISCGNTATVDPVFTAYGDLDLGDGGDTGTFTAVWRLTVSDGVSSDFQDVTLTVTLANH